MKNFRRMSGIAWLIQTKKYFPFSSRCLYEVNKMFIFHLNFFVGGSVERNNFEAIFISVWILSGEFSFSTSYLSKCRLFCGCFNFSHWIFRRWGREIGAVVLESLQAYRGSLFFIFGVKLDYKMFSLLDLPKSTKQLGVDKCKWGIVQNETW